MASLVLGIVGNAVLPGIGGVLGSLAGAAIDSFIIAPMLFGAEDTTNIGPRLDDVRVQTASEGSPFQYCLGNRCRIAGNVIWISDLIEESVTTSQSSGGKGGGGATATSTTYNYYISMAVGLCETPTGAIDGVWKVWLNGKLFYKDTGAQSTISGTDFEAKPLGGGVTRYLSYDNGQGDFTDLFTGQPVTISGFPDAGNNGTFTVLETASFSGGTYVEVSNASGVADSSPVGATATFTQTAPTYSGADRFTVYDGAQTTPDSLIEAAEGDSPAYTGLAYMVFERLALANYGNSIPQAVCIISTEDVTNTTKLSLEDAIERIHQRAGLDPSEYDLSAITPSNKVLRGYTISGPKTVTQQLEPILLAYDILVREDEGVLTYFFKGEEDTVTVSAADVGATFGEEKLPQIVFNKLREVTLPQEVTIKFLDPNKSVQAGSVSERRINAPHDQVDVVDLPLTLSENEARQIARRRLWRTWQNLLRAKLTLPARYFYIQEADVVTVPWDGENYSIFVEKLTRGDNGIIELEGPVEQNRTYNDFDGDGSGGDDPADEGPYIPPMMQGMWMDVPPLSNDQVDATGYYTGACAASYDASFLSWILEQSPDDITYTVSAASALEAVIFRVVQDFSGSVQDAHQLDRANTLTVRLLHGTLTTAEESDFNDGANRVLLFSSGASGEYEILAFQTVTVVDAATKTYALTNLRRGLRNTQAAIGNAVADAYGIVLNTGVQFVVLADGDVGDSFYYKYASLGQPLDDAVSLARTFTGRTRLNFPPCHVSATRDSSNNVTLTWYRRTRGLFKIFTGAVPPLYEDEEVYEIDLLASGGGSVYETYQVTGATEATITDADIVAAGYVSGASITIRIYQISGLLGRGDAEEVTL